MPETAHAETVRPLRDDDGIPVFVQSQLKKKYGVSQSFITHWLKQESRHRPGPALRHSTIPNPHPFGGGGPTCKGYWMEDVERILRGEESRPDRRGSGRRRSCRRRLWLGMPDDATAEMLLREFLALAPRPAREIYAWRRQQKISWRQLYRVKEALKIKERRPTCPSGETGSQKGIPEYWCLPGQEPPELLTEFAKGAKRFIENALADEPLPAAEILERGRKLKYSRTGLYRVAPLAGVVFRRGYRGKPYWCLHGQELPAESRPGGDGAEAMPGRREVGGACPAAPPVEVVNEVRVRIVGDEREPVKPAVRADSRTDKEKKSSRPIPENPDVLALAKKINKERRQGGSMKEIALDYTEGDEQMAESLLRQLRRFPDLLD